MIAFWGNIKKEFLLLIRDKTGLAFLFIMPIALVLLMTLLQDKTIKKFQQEEMSIAIVNSDNDILGNALIEGLSQAPIFDVHQTNKNGDTLNEEMANTTVMNGEYSIGVIIPKKSTRSIKRIVSNELRKQTPSLGGQVLPDSLLKNIEILIFFDPQIKASLRQGMEAAISQIIANVQTQIIFKSYSKAIEKITGKVNNDNFPLDKIRIKQIASVGNSNKSIPSSTQHNVPAWTVFAIFFMVIPIATQIITERDNGSSMRLKLSSTSAINPILARIIVYSLLSVIQAMVLLFIGIFIMPLLGMDAFNIHGLYFSFIIFTLLIGLTAAAYGMAIGNIAKTHHQASVFGSISVVLLAAIGGIWVPTYAMPSSMVNIAELSPLNWSLSGYYDIVLKGNGLNLLWVHAIKLIAFLLLSLLIAVIFQKQKKL